MPDQSESLPEDRVILDLPVRSIIDWELDKTKKAQREADTGNLSLAAELCEALMKTDGRIRGPLSQRTSVLRLPTTFVPGSGPQASAAAIAIDPAQGGDHDELFEASEFEKIHAWGLVLGVCPYRLNWWENGKARKRNGRNVPALEFWHPRHLRQDPVTREWKLAIDGGKEITITEDGDEFGLYLPYGKNRPWADGLWLALKLYWIAGLLSFEDWNRYNEKLGIGAFVAKAPDGTKADDPIIPKLAKQLRNLGREKAFALPAGWILELIESSARSPDAFEKLIALVDTCKAITILGQNLTTEVKGGSFAAAAAHKAVSADVLEFDARIVRTQKRKFLRSWAKFNYGSADAAPSANLDTTPPEDVSALVDGWNKLGESTRKLLDDGYDPDLDQMARMVKLPQRGPAKARFPSNPVAPLPSGFSANAGGAGRVTALAAGKSQGTAFERGRDYVDRLETEICAHAAKELAPTVAAMRAAIEDSTSYDDALARITAAYGDELPPSKLLKLTEAALILGQLAGRETVEQEFRADE
jgi:hypothetical protein